MAAAAVAEAATLTPLAVLQHQAKETRVGTAEPVHLNSVALAVVVLVGPESMAKHLPQQVARDFPTTRFSTLVAAAAAAVALYRQAAVVVWVVTVETVLPDRKLEAMGRLRVEVAAVAQDPTVSELAKRVATVPMAWWSFDTQAQQAQQPLTPEQ